MPQSFSPAFDGHIPRRYSAATLDQKVQNKTTLQKELGWPEESKRPIVCFPAGMTETLGGALLRELLPGMLTQQIEILVLGKGSSEYGSLFTSLAKEHGHRIHIVKNDDESIRAMLAAADMAMFLSDVLTKEISQCLAYGVVPLSLPQPKLEDYDPVQEAGNAFLFAQPTPWHAFASLVRALETFKFPFDWRTIQRHCMETVKNT